MRKELLTKLAVDEENHDYLVKNYQEGGRFKLFSNVFFGKMGNMAKVNWWMVLFVLPVLAALIFMMYKAYDYATYTPFSANYGLGYPVISDSEEVYAELIYKNNIFRALLLIPCIIIAFIGLAGAFNVIKYESLGYNTKVSKEFFKGIKNHFVPFMWLGLVNALLYLSLEFALNFYGNPDLHLAWKIITIAVNVLALIFSLTVSFYAMTQEVMYNLPFGKLLKNSLHFTVSFVVQNLIIFVFSMIPVGLLFLLNASLLVQMLIIMALAMVGVSYIVCVWTVYGHYVYNLIFSAVIEQNKPAKVKNKKKAKAK